MLQQMREAGKFITEFPRALAQGLRQEWQEYGKTGQIAMVASGAAVALAMAAVYTFTEPKCPTHPLVGVGNPEFRCATQNYGAQPPQPK